MHNAQMDSLSNMQLFVLVVHEGSFSAASRYLGITPSSVSRQISQLEAELDTRLFQRTTRKQSLTEAGNIYFQYSQRIVDDINAAKLAVSRLSDTPSGNLHITAETDFALAYITPLLPLFLSQYPDIDIRLSMSVGLEDLVNSGIDLAIRIGHLNDSSLVARKLAMSHSVVCASPEYIKQNGLPSHPQQLEKHSCLSFQVKPGANHWRFKLSQGVVDIPVSGRVKVDSVAILREAALAGLGIILVPSWIVAKELKQGKLLPLLEDFPLEPNGTPINAVFSHNRHLAPKVRSFVDFLVEQMPSL